MGSILSKLNDDRDDEEEVINALKSRLHLLSEEEKVKLKTLQEEYSRKWLHGPLNYVVTLDRSIRW